MSAPMRNLPVEQQETSLQGLDFRRQIRHTTTSCRFFNYLATSRPISTTPCARYRALAGQLDKLETASDAAPTGVAKPRPSPSSSLELHTLQALDGTLSGASLRTIASVLYGTDAVSKDWHADSDLRARVRRLVRRGKTLMRGGYRRLAQLPPPLPLD